MTKSSEIETNASEMESWENTGTNQVVNVSLVTGNDQLQCVQPKNGTEWERLLYEKVKNIIWVLRMTGMHGRNVVHTYSTGFCVEGGVMFTCAHAISKFRGCSVKARRLDEEDFIHECEVVSLKTKWDVCLLKVKGLDNVCSGELASDGSLYAVEKIFHIGHPDEFVGSFLTGEVAYPCLESVEFPPNRLVACLSYESNAVDKTPLYRVMGNVWNKAVFKILEHSDEKKKQEGKFDRLTFEKNLDSSLPIIQCNGLNCEGGCSGGPIFNADGKVVGMLLGASGVYQIAIHVTALRYIINSESQSPANPGTSSSTQDGSKKRKSIETQ